MNRLSRRLLESCCQGPGVEEGGDTLLIGEADGHMNTAVPAVDTRGSVKGSWSGSASVSGQGEGLESGSRLGVGSPILRGSLRPELPIGRVMRFALRPNDSGSGSSVGVKETSQSPEPPASVVVTLNSRSEMESVGRSERHHKWGLRGRVRAGGRERGRDRGRERDSELEATETNRRLRERGVGERGVGDEGEGWEGAVTHTTEKSNVHGHRRKAKSRSPRRSELSPRLVSAQNMPILSRSFPAESESWLANVEAPRSSQVLGSQSVAAISTPPTTAAPLVVSNRLWRKDRREREKEKEKGKEKEKEKEKEKKRGNFSRTLLGVFDNVRGDTSQIPTATTPTEQLFARHTPNSALRQSFISDSPKSSAQSSNDPFNPSVDESTSRTRLRGEYGRDQDLRKEIEQEEDTQEEDAQKVKSLQERSTPSEPPPQPPPPQPSVLESFLPSTPLRDVSKSPDPEGIVTEVSPASTSISPTSASPPGSSTPHTPSVHTLGVSESDDAQKEKPPTSDPPTVQKSSLQQAAIGKPRKSRRRSVAAPLPPPPFTFLSENSAKLSPKLSDQGRRDGEGQAAGGELNQRAVKIARRKAEILKALQSIKFGVTQSEALVACFELLLRGQHEWTPLFPDDLDEGTSDTGFGSQIGARLGDNKGERKASGAFLKQSSNLDASLRRLSSTGNFGSGSSGTLAMRDDSLSGMPLMYFDLVEHRLALRAGGANTLGAAGSHLSIRIWNIKGLYLWQEASIRSELHPYLRKYARALIGGGDSLRQKLVILEFVGDDRNLMRQILVLKSPLEAWAFEQTLLVLRSPIL